MRTATLCLAACAAIGMSSACLADDMVAAEQFGGTSLGFLLKGTLNNATLTVSGPDDFHASASSKTGAVALDLGKQGAVEDGLYTYQITAASADRAKVRTSLDNGRDREAEMKQYKGVTMSGTFLVKDGKVVQPAPAAKESRRDAATGGVAK
jgi:hypothetical protein